MASTNIRRLMARSGMTVRDVVERTGLHERTVKALLAGTHKPHAKTLHKLATGFGVGADAVLADDGPKTSDELGRLFDSATNSTVREFFDAHRSRFHEWTALEIDELFSRFGAGGELTDTGVSVAVEKVEQHRDILDKVAFVLESDRGEFLAELVDTLFQNVTDLSGPSGRPG